MHPPFAVWITGLPSSGKSTVSRELIRILSDDGYTAVHLESDELRHILIPQADYSLKERDWFYGVMATLGALLIRNGVSVVLDATANKRAYRDRARQTIPRFMEVYVKCPLQVCMARDVKGIYRRGQEGKTRTVPGLQEAYEEPLAPELIVSGENDLPQETAQFIVEELKKRGWIS